jgi:exodeoxyribonuclease VII large subunit
MSAILPPGVRVLTVSELTHSIKGALEEGWSDVWVEGEVSNLARPSSGHLYLTLKDEETPLRAVIYRGIALRMKFDLRDGLHVIVRGRLSVYTPRGEYQLLIEEVHPRGIGPLELAFRQLKEKLFTLGYFDPRRKKPLPPLPRRICLVTSPTGSAVRDMLEILGRRWPAVEVWICPVRVQGEGASTEIAEAIALLNRLAGPGSPQPVDLLIVGRGGGSLEDLWPFNEEVVAHAIFHSRIPIVSGVGHEDDLTIADLVADCRALTPSEAAERVVPDRADILAWLSGLEVRLRTLLLRQLEASRTRLDELASRACLRRPLDRLRDAERQIDEWSGRLDRAVQVRLEQARQRLENLTGRLENLSPLKVLGRGYSLTRRLEDLSVLHSVTQVQPGDWIVSQLHDGRVVSRVETMADNARTDE